VYATGRIEQGVAYGVYRRNTYVMRDGKRVQRAKNVKNKGFHWTSPDPIEAPQAAAVTAMAALTLLPDSECSIILTVPSEAAELLQHYRDFPHSSPLPALAPWSVPPATHQLLVSAELHIDNALTLSVPGPGSRLDEDLIAKRRESIATSVAANLAPQSTPVPHGAWVADFSGATNGEIGIVAVHRSGSAKTPATFLVPGFGSSLHGELIAVLIAYAQARLAGDPEPVVYNDYVGTEHQLQVHADGPTPSCGAACNELMQALGLGEVRRVRTQWAARNSRPFRHVDRKARWARRKLGREADWLIGARGSWQAVLDDAQAVALLDANLPIAPDGTSRTLRHPQ
jgi:hypothetical protein